MNTFTILTTSMRTIVVQAENSVEASAIASKQFLDDGEAVIMCSSTVQLDTMHKKYDDLIWQLVQWYHLELSELNDLKWFLESHIRTIDMRREIEHSVKPKAIIKLIQEHLDDHKQYINQVDEEDWSYVYFDYMNECQSESPLDAVENCNFESVDFNLWWEQWYLNWMENILRIITNLTQPWNHAANNATMNESWQK